MAQLLRKDLRFYEFGKWSYRVITWGAILFISVMLHVYGGHSRPPTVWHYALIVTFGLVAYVGSRTIFHYRFVKPFAAHLGVEPQVLTASKHTA